jgi:hypothetical protein
MNRIIFFVKMEFVYSLDDLCLKYNSRKDNIKRKMHDIGFQEGVDFTVTSGINERKHGGHNRESIMLTKKAADQLDIYFALRKRNVNASFNVTVNYVKRYIPKEIEVLGFIIDVFSPIYEVKKQFTATDISNGY